MKKTISTILAIAGVIGFLFLIGGGIRMSTLASQSGDSVAEYYYQSMGTCMIGFSFVAAGLLWGLSWMVAAWPDNQGIIGALTDKTPDSRTCAPAGCATVETDLFSREEKTPTGGTGEQSS